jgi:hypothetical protein
MDQPRARVYGPQNDHLGFDCPGCGQMHSIRFGSGEGPRWAFNGDVDRPTITPSVRCWWKRSDDQIEHVCHFFITEGRAEFCSDCTHEFAGKTVELPPFSSPI